MEYLPKTLDNIISHIITITTDQWVQEQGPFDDPPPPRSFSRSIRSSKSSERRRRKCEKEDKKKHNLFDGHVYGRK